VNFYIGQPVRIVHSQVYEGTEAVVASRLIRFVDCATGARSEGYEVLVNGTLLRAWGAVVMPAPEQLEPRTPEGMESPEETAELFEPECELVIVR